MSLDLHDITTKAIALVKDTGHFIREERQKWSLSDLKHKKDKSLVTSLDIASEQRLLAGLKVILPEAEALAEENHNQESIRPLMWIIDPIDGTTNFVHNFPMFCISLALWQEGEIVMGIIYDISHDECFWAHAALHGAYLNEEPMYVSQIKTVEHSILATGFPSSGFEQIDEFLDHFRTFMCCTQGIRRLGSAALDLAYVACGRCDGFYEYCLNPWDVAAGSFLVTKAGGRVTDFKGGNDFIFGRRILASNNLIHEEFLQHFNKNN